MSWSVRYSTDTAAGETGGTGLPSEEFARATYERLVDRVREHGGSVELLRDGERVLIFTCNPKGGSATK